MKRRAFFALPLALPAVPSLAALLTGEEPAEGPATGLLVAAGQDRFGKSFEYLGARFDLKVSGQDSNGALSIYDTTRFEKTGPSLHTHTNLDE